MAYLEAILNLIESSGGHMSFAEIGRRLGISREWVRRLARRAGSDAGRVEFTCEVCGSNVIIGRREKEILQLVADGYSTNQIAEQLSIAQGSVRSAIHKLKKKLHAKDRTGTVAIAIERGLIQTPKV